MILNQPLGSERRITLRLLAYWEKMRAGRPMPSEKDIRPGDVQDLWDNCFLIQVANPPRKSDYKHLGDAIRRAYLGGDLEDHDPRLISMDPAELEAHYERIITTKEPVVDEGEFRNPFNETIRYRQCLLPLGENGRVKAIFGGMRFRVFPSKA
jgi:hypothetical protein